LKLVGGLHDGRGVTGLRGQQPQAERQPDQPLLGSVVQVPLELAPLVVAGFDEPDTGSAQLADLGERLRLQPRVLQT
jgi:hypothetical protein